MNPEEKAAQIVERLSKLNRHARRALIAKARAKAKADKRKVKP